MLRFVLKKMVHNKWLFACLTFSAIMINSLICSIPIYTSANASRILTKKLEKVISEEGKDPGSVKVNCKVGLHLEKDSPVDVYKTFEKDIVTAYKEKTPLPVYSERVEVNMKNIFAVPLVYLDDTQGVEGITFMEGTCICSIRNIEDHIKIIAGHGFSKEPEIIDTGIEVAPKAQVVELIIEKEALSRYNIPLDTSLIIVDQYNHENLSFNSKFKPEEFVIAKVVGVYEKVDDGTGFWEHGESFADSAFVIKEEVMLEQVCGKHYDWFNEANWYLKYNYKDMDYQKAQICKATYESAIETCQILYPNKTEVTAGFMAPITTSNDEIKELSKDIMLLMIPILIMLAMFIFMITHFIINADHSEIATLRSRGATKGHIFSIYLTEGLFMSGVAILVGPVLAVGICKFLGSSNGFLSLIGRKSLIVSINGETYVYAVMAQLLFMLNMFVPVVLYSNVNVLEHSKRNVAKKKSWWKLCGVDFIALGASIYLIAKYYKKVQVMLQEEIKMADTGLDPVLYLVSTLFILGAALLFLRVYPLIIRFISFIGRKHWSVTFYATFKQIERLQGNELFILLFMIMAIGMGILNANEARSYNQHNEESIRYTLGGDVVFVPDWVDFNEVRWYGSGSNAAPPEPRPDYWIEPDVNGIREIEGIENICKVAHKEPYASYIDGKMIHGKVNMMAIEPYAFGKVTWYKNGLLPVHINEYLNMMTRSKQTIFVTSNAKKQYDMKIGDPVDLLIQDSKGFDSGRITGVICGFVDAWPGVEMADSEGKEVVTFITNYHYVENIVGVIPYDIWLDLGENVKEKDILSQIEEKEITYDNLFFQDSQVIEMRNIPYNMGVNGILTLGFIVIMLITTIGVFIYWILAIKERSLQFGIMRAMGVKKGGIYRMLLLEQLLLFGSSIIVGVLIGTLTSEMVVPLLQLLGREVTDTYPVVVAFKRSDYLKVYLITLIMIGSSMAVIASMMHKIKIADILKLGEER